MIRVSFTPSVRITMKKIRKDVETELFAFGDELLQNVKTQTPYREGKARRGWNSRRSKQKVTLENRVPYIERLENNYSKQTKGRGIMKPAIRQTVKNRRTR